MIRAVLFDLEGTLVDFQWQLREAEAELRAALAPLGFDPALFGGADYAGIRRLALERADTESLRAEIDARLAPIYDRYDRDALSRWQVRDGAVELARELAARGLRLAVVSNIGRAAAWAALEKFGLRESFDRVIAREDVAQMKPSGEGIRQALAAFQVPPECALMVGDSLTDLRAARDAGVAVALIAGGETVHRGLGAEAPDHSIAHLGEVLGILAAEQNQGGASAPHDTERRVP